MEFNKRIQKLESDIHLISSIRDILMSNNGSLENNENGGRRLQNITSPEVELPVRDSGRGDADRIIKQPPSKKTSCKTNLAATGRKTITSCLAKKSSENSENIKSVEIVKKNDAQYQTCLEKLQNEIATEITNRLDAEESAKIVAIRLQKVEDDLRREKEIKKSLLEGTLEMKNQLQGYHSEISVLEKRITDLQSENAKLSSDFKSLEDDKLQEVTQYQTQTHLLEMEKARLVNQRCKLENELRTMITKNSELKATCQKVQGTFETQEDNLKTQLQDSVERFTVLDAQKQKIEQQLQLAQNRIEILQEKLKSSHLEMKNQEQDSSLKLKEKEEQIKSLNSTLKQERDNLSQKIDAATALVSRTKSFIIGLQNENQVKENQSQKYLLDIRQLQQEKAEWVKMVQELKKNADHQNDFRERFWSLSQKSVEKTRQLEQDRENLKQELKQKVDKLLDMKKNQELLHQELSNTKKKYEEEKIARESAAKSLRDQFQRVSDNLQILQKISEDQGKTIGKQRNELETNSDLRYKLELQLRESTATEKALVIRLRDEENSNKELERQISHFENELSILNKEVKQHDCEEFVESKLLGKVKELERKVSGLEGEIKSKEEDCEKALAAARKAVSQATQLKESFEQKILKIKTSNSNEIMKLRQEKQQQDAEKNKKICDLESEVLRMRESWRQMQNAYLTKIQQLQNALNACCVGVGVGMSTGNGASSQHGFNFGFPPQSPCAANFNVGGIHGVPSFL